MSQFALDIKRVYHYTLALSANLKTNVREGILHKCQHLKCSNCGKPVLEHEYDKERDIVLCWAGNCAILRHKRAHLHSVK